jgi:putative FmdB family regulatory protein
LAATSVHERDRTVIGPLGVVLVEKEVAFLPIYEYECEACNHKFEVIQKVSDKPIKKCVLCQGKVHKILSAPGLLFKGSGWYVTDYANPERKKAMDADKKAASGDSGGTKTESKAETKEPKKSGTD